MLATEPFCDLGKGVSLELTQGSTMLANVYTPDDIGSAEMYLYIGDNQAETRPVNFGMVNNWRLANNARMVVVDPRQTVTALKQINGSPFALAQTWHWDSLFVMTSCPKGVRIKSFCLTWIDG